MKGNNHILHGIRVLIKKFLFSTYSFLISLLFMAGKDPKHVATSLFRPALTILNISNFINLTRDNTIRGLSNSRSHSFRVNSSGKSLKHTDPDLWSKIDAIMLQWIYGIISHNFLNIIWEQDTTIATTTT